MHVSNSMNMLNSSSQILQWAKLWLITNCPINLSIGCPMDCNPKMAKQFPCPRYLLIKVSLLSALSCNLLWNEWLVHLILVSISKASIKLYDHVEQLISSSAMSKVVTDNKSPNKSVNMLPYGLFTLRLQNNSSVKDICLYRCVTAYRVIL